MAPCLMMFTRLPCLCIHSPSLAPSIAQSCIGRQPGLKTDLEERQCLMLSATFPCARHTAKTILYRRTLKCIELKSHSWKMQSPNSNPVLLTSEPVLISPQQKMFSSSFHWDGGGGGGGGHSSYPSFCPISRAYLRFLASLISLIDRGVHQASQVIRDLLERKQRWWDPSRWWNPGQLHMKKSSRASRRADTVSLLKVQANSTASSAYTQCYSLHMLKSPVHTCARHSPTETFLMTLLCIVIAA